jgi:hypothetical protein
MLMNMNQSVGNYAMFTGCGRMNKGLPVTDPDGTGAGASYANPRGRYDGIHVHRNGPGPPTAMQSMFTGNLVIGGKSWSYVNHDSNVCFDSNIAYRYGGSAFQGEIGTETGCFCDNTAIRSTFAPQATDPAVGSTGDDWGKFGTGYFTMGGGITFQGVNVSTGSSHMHACIMGLPFVKGGPFTFDLANIPSLGKTGKVAPNTVPQVIPDGALVGWGGGAFGFVPWALNGNPDHVAPVGRSSIGKCFFEQADKAVELGYLSCLDFNGTQGKSKINPGKAGTFGVGHSGVNGNCTFNGVTMDGYATGIQAATDEVFNTITNCRFRCLTGVYVQNPRHRPFTLAINGITMDPVTDAPLATLDQWKYFYFVQLQNRQQYKVLMRWDGVTISLYADFNGYVYLMPSAFPQQLGHPRPIGQYTITLDGQRLYFPEQDPAWPLSNIHGVPAPYNAYATTGDLWTKGGEAIGGELLPAGLTKLAGVYAVAGAGDTTIPPEGPPVPPPTTVAIPNLIGMTPTQANTALQAVKLSLGTATPQMVVVSQNPPAGTQVSPGSTVTVVYKLP